MKKIVHIDLNAFFAQAETLLDPSLKNKPLIVGNANKRGVVATASYEARKFGVSSGMSMTDALNKCPNAIVKNSNFNLYHKLSRQFFSYLKSRFPILEQASIDECYIDMTNYLIDGKEYDQLFDLQMDLYMKTRLKCSIGLGNNKFLAKMGSDMKKPLGLTIINSNNLKEILWPLSIDKMYGIGKKTAPKLKEVGINTIGDLAVTNDERVKKLLGSMFQYFKDEANGIGDSYVNNNSFDPKSISAERTFLDDETNYDVIENMIKNCCVSITRELKQYDKLAVAISIKLRTPDFVTKSKRKTLISPSDNIDTIFNFTMNLFDNFYSGEPLRLIGVGFDKVIDKKDANIDINKQNDIIKLINDYNEGEK